MERDGTPVSKATAATLAAEARIEAATVADIGAAAELSLDLESIPDLDLAELRGLSALFQDKLTAALAVGDVRLAKGLLEGRILVAREVARLRPPTPPDPARDPANVAAREDLRARLERLREASRASPPAVEQARAWLEGGA